MSLRLSLLLAATLPFANSALASWADVPLDKLIRSEPLIITGKVGEAKPIDWSPVGRPMAVAEITVDTVLKNSVPGLELKSGSTVPLLMPAQGKIRVSTDIIYKEGTEGVWLLDTVKGKDYFAATYPKDYQLMKNLATIEKALREAEASVMVEVSCKIPKPSRELKGAALIGTLFEYDPLLADAAAKQVDQKVLSGIDLRPGRDFRSDFTLKADRNERRKYYVTLFLHPDDKGGERLYYADGFNKVCEDGGNFERLELELKPGRR